MQAAGLIPVGEIDVWHMAKGRVGGGIRATARTVLRAAVRSRGHPCRSEMWETHCGHLGRGQEPRQREGTDRDVAHRIHGDVRVAKTRLPTVTP